MKLPNSLVISTFRIHGESGVQEGSFEFWKTVFDGVATCGRRVAIDMHPKGMSEQMTEIALATKQPVTMSPKFWGEYMGMCAVSPGRYSKA